MHKYVDTPAMSEEKPKRICASIAKSEYGLSETDLDILPCWRVSNPHYRSAAPMRLYEESAVISASIEKAERVKYLEDHKEEIAEAKRVQAKERADAVKHGAALEISKFQQPKPLPGGSTVLPVELWGMILQNLIDDLEDDGIRTVMVVAQEICAAASSCRDLWTAGNIALRVLAEPFQKLLPPGLDNAVRHPTELKLPQLRSIAKGLGCTVCGTKAVVIMRILNHCGVHNPTTVPPALLLIAATEKNSLANHYIPQHILAKSATAGLYINRTETVFIARKLLAQYFGSHRNLNMIQPKPEYTITSTCACGNTPSPHCGHCKCCCKGPCRRHGQP